MTVNSKYTKNFVSDNLTDLKYNQLKSFAIQLRNYKNQISNEINDNLLQYLNIGKFEFISLMRQNYPKAISSYFEEALYTQIYNAYELKFKAIQHKLEFKYREFQQFNHYKRNTKHNKKGDLKSISYKSVSTPLTICLTYLSRYGNENIINYIQDNYNVSLDKLKFYDNIIRCCNKFGFKRLYELALRKRNRILSLYRTPIAFKSLTFSGKTTNINSIVSNNKNRRSKISSFISINVPFRKGLDIPVKYSSKYHGNINEYKKSKDKALYCYVLKIDEYKSVVTIQLCKDGLRYYPENNTNYIGIDVNVKHNLFALSNGQVYDFDRKLVNEYLTELNKVDYLKIKNKEYLSGKRKSIKLQTLQRKIKQSNLLLIVKVCKDLLGNNLNHIVLENLDNSFSKSYVRNKETNEKYTRLTHILNIGSLKDEFKHIAKNYNISVSFVLAEYTSQLCEQCGCIDTENRPTLELFICSECGCTMNADIHAAINIKNRVQETVFQTALLKQNPDGSFIPKKLNHLQIKLKIYQSIVLILLNKTKLSNIS